MRRSGGRSHPVSHGESARAIHPEGAIRKAMPKAAAACGTDRSGDSNRSNARKDRVPDHPAQTRATMPSDTAVAARPVVTDRRTAAPRPGQSNRARNGAGDGPSAPAAGR